MQETAQAKLQSGMAQVWSRRGLLAWLLWPVSLLMLLAVRFRQGLYLSGVLDRYSLPVPVIVVGNIVVGGTGKTPVVMALVRHLQSQGWQPGVISRGYGRLDHTCREVLEIDPVALVGDEPALIKRSTRVPVFVASKRIEAGRALLAKYPAVDVLISDDGLQHYQLRRDIEICLFDDRGLGNGFLLPSGLLRESWPRAVDLILHTGSRPAFAGFTSQRGLAKEAVSANGKKMALTALAELKGVNIIAIAAIGQPENFFGMLRSSGIVPSKTMAYPDHYDYSNWCPPSDSLWLCTEKDAVKLWDRFPDVLAVPLEFTPEPSFLAALDQLLENCKQTPVSSAHGHSTS